MPSAASRRPIRLHRFRMSGHSHRAELFLSLLGLPVELVDVDLAARAHKRPEFLRLNVFGQVPVLEDDGVVVPDSNAILVYLASRYDKGGRWLPRDPEGAARVQRWLAVAAGPLASGPAAARLVKKFGAPLNLPAAQQTAAALLSVMDHHLEPQPFFAGDTPTLADVALYTYTAVAHEGDVPLDAYGRVRAWLRRVEALPGFVPMPLFPATSGPG